MKHHILPSFILRTPVNAFGSRIDCIRKYSLTKEQVKEIFTDSAFVESIYIASPELYEETIKWLETERIEKKEEDKLIFSLFKYISRMEVRPTPFGLFAGCEVGKISEKTEIILSGIENFKRHTRLDMNFLCDLSKDLSHKDEIKKKLQFFPNSSLYPLGDKYRYVEYHYEKSKRIHHTVSIERTYYIDDILSTCRNGATYFEIVKSIESDGISMVEASDYVSELISNQIIVSELEPSTTGPEQLEYSLSILEKIQEVPDITRKLKWIAAELDAIDDNGLGNSIDRYDGIKNAVKETGTSYEKKFLFQTDLVVKTQKNSLSGKIPEMVKQGIAFLSKISRFQDSGNLGRFKEAFSERYEEREVPFVEALDTELGIGYGSNDTSVGDVNPLVDELRIPGKAGAMEFDMKWNIFQSFLLKKYREAIENNLSEVTFSDEEVNEIVRDIPAPGKLSDTFSAMIEVIESNPENDKYKIVLKNAGGSTGAYLLGRFCHGDPGILKVVNEIVTIEDELAGESILAEIVHLPESRTGNVLLRPVIRKYEIPYLARSSISRDFQLKLDDLYLSVKNNQIILRSKKLKRVIIPRLTNAHNFSFNALPVYQFLCDLQYQGRTGGLSFSWGSLSNEHPFLPRVIYNNLILSPAQWNLKISDVKKNFEEKEDEKLLENVRKWRSENKIPVQVLLSDGDNDLYLDLEVPIFLRMLWSTIKSRQVFKFEEFLYNPEKPLVKGPDGWHTNEIILVFRNDNKV